MCIRICILFRTAFPVRIRICFCLCTHTYVHSNVDICNTYHRCNSCIKSKHIYIYMFRSLYTCIYTCFPVYIYLQIYIYTKKYFHIYICINLCFYLLSMLLSLGSPACKPAFTTTPGLGLQVATAALALIFEFVRDVAEPGPRPLKEDCLGFRRFWFALGMGLVMGFVWAGFRMGLGWLWDDFKMTSG